MRDFIATFTSSTFMPHGMCYLWNPPLLWTHVLSDSAIGVAYVTISTTLAYLVYRIRDIPFQWIYLAFGGFIIACGGTHFMEVWTVWHPDYWASASLKVLTATVSVGTALLLPALVPRAADLVRAAQLAVDRGMTLETAYRDLGTLYERSKEVEQLKTQFFANVSHELRTPLALILGPAERLASSPALGDQERRQLDVITRNARTLLKHVNDLLDISKLEAQKMVPDYVRVDLARLVRVIAANFELVADEKEIAFRVDTPDQLLADVDADQIQKIVTNLLSNAFKFTPVHGCLRCSLDSTQTDDAVGRYAVLTVADSGPGIPVSLRESVFERFRQLEDSSTRQFGGTGLGLAIVRDFVRLHRGDVRVGHAPEGGALFEVRVPLTAPVGVPVRSPATEATANAEAVAQVIAELRTHVDTAMAMNDIGRGVVLIAEDNVDMNRFIADTLAQDHYDVHRAFDGDEAFEKAVASPPDLILTDVMMPRLSGDQLVQKIRQQPALASIPIILLTAKADDDLRVRLLREGAQDYIMKPFAAEELRARVANQVVIKRTRDILQRELDQQLDNLADLASEVTNQKRELRSTLEVMQVARDRAEHASQTKSDFLGLISHEFRTPLTTLLLNLRLLRQDDAKLTPKQRDLVERTTSSSRRLLDMIEALLEYARLESGRLKVQREIVDVHLLAKELVEEFRPEAERKGIELRIERVDRDPALISDTRLLRLALGNLISNAVKYTKSGHVSLQVLCADAQCRFVVSDSGEGIPLNAQDRIFEPFEQLEPIDRKHLPGVGLGLALVRELVDALGGRVELQSRVGVGSTFTLMLPIAGPSVARSTKGPQV